MIYFFSSRRRHTRWPRDWSSDVCSSDLIKNLTSSNTGPYIYSMEGLQQIKSQLADSLHQKEYEELMQKATFFLQKDDFQFVADKLHTAPSGNKNDYMSLHRYKIGRAHV